MDPHHFKVKVEPVWEGPHGHIPKDYKQEALRSLDAIIWRAQVSRRGIRDLAARVKDWFVRNPYPLPGYPGVRLVRLRFGIYKQKTLIAEINGATGKVLHMDPTVK